MQTLARRAIRWTLFLLPLLAGCSAQSQPQLGAWVGPADSSPITVEHQAYTDADVRIVHTPHYTIYSTIEDENFLKKVGQLMEGAYSVYQTLAPEVHPTAFPMKCFLFDQRSQWADFTRKQTGPDAPIYLQINRGGYTVHDWYVAYYLGEGTTCSVAAHEGWHQYVARHFKGRLPPFLEEGIATTFEGVQFKDDLPRFNFAINQTRAIALRRACENKELWPLDQLIQMHAGMVVDKTGGKIEAFYAQAWAFARFLWDGEGGKYRPAFQSLLNDIAAGTVWDPTGSHRNRTAGWNPAAVKPMLEHYMGVPFSQIDAEYNRYIQVLAYDQLAAQSESVR